MRTMKRAFDYLERNPEVVLVFSCGLLCSTLLGSVLHDTLLGTAIFAVYIFIAFVAVPIIQVRTSGESKTHWLK